MNIKSFFTQEYLFQINSAVITPGEKLFLYSGAILVLLAIVLKIAESFAPSPVDKKLRNKLFSVFIFSGISELVWYFFRYENVMFFGSHFVAWLIVAIGAVWLILTLVKVLKNYSKEKEAWTKEQQKLKYLPK